MESHTSPGCYNLLVGLQLKEVAMWLMEDIVKLLGFHPP
jgi:hypothetical protein